MSKNKKSHRRPGPGKPQGATYAQMLALRQSVVGPWAAHHVARAKRVD